MLAVHPSVRLVFVLFAVLLAGCGSSAAVSGRGASPTTSATAISQPSLFPSAAPTRTTRTFVDADLGFKLDLPAPWRPSSCNSSARTDAGIYAARADFVAVDELHETGSDVGRQYASVGVTITDNKDNLTPRQWIDMGKVGFSAGMQVQDADFGGQKAVRLMPGGTYFFAARGRMWAVGADLQADASLQPTADAIVASFRLLSDDDLASVHAQATSSLPPRSLDELIAGLSAGFAKRDADSLAPFISDCFGNALENAGAAFGTRTKEVADLRAAFAAGLTVAVQPRPVKGDASLGNAAIGSTWSGDGLSARSVDLSLRDEGGRWRWVATVRLQPAR